MHTWPSTGAAGAHGVFSVSDEGEDTVPADHSMEDALDETFDCPPIVLSKDPDCNFEICDWSDYPDSVVERPTGPFRLRKGSNTQPGTEQYEARKKAKAANARLHTEWNASFPADRGKYQFHEIQPVKFGGDPAALSNKKRMKIEDHRIVTKWWNTLERRIRAVLPGSCQ